MKDSHTRLREQFQEFADGIVWSNDDGSEKYIGVGNMADWWLNKFSTELESIRKEIEDMHYYGDMCEVREFRESVLDYLSNRIQK